MRQDEFCGLMRVAAFGREGRVRSEVPTPIDVLENRNNQSSLSMTLKDETSVCVGLIQEPLLIFVTNCRRWLLRLGEEEKLIFSSIDNRRPYLIDCLSLPLNVRPRFFHFHCSADAVNKRKTLLTFSVTN